MHLLSMPLLLTLYINAQCIIIANKANCNTPTQDERWCLFIIAGHPSNIIHQQCLYYFPPHIFSLYLVGSKKKSKQGVGPLAFIRSSHFAPAKYFTAIFLRLCTLGWTPNRPKTFQLESRLKSSVFNFMLDKVLISKFLNRSFKFVLFFIQRFL